MPLLIREKIRALDAAGAAAPARPCRSCSAALPEAVFDLGPTPLANSYLSASDLAKPETYFPLRLFLCQGCGLLQLEAAATPEQIFGHYAYFSSYSSTLLAHAEQFAAAAFERVGLTPSDVVVEVASNDGYQLRYFKSRGCTVLGVEPARNVAQAAVDVGIPTVSRFFGTAVAEDLVREGYRPRLIVANNVVAHVPDLNDFLAGLARLLPEDGTLSLEFHHVLALVQHSQFDIVYHEHCQYFSLGSISAALRRHGLEVTEVELLDTQGGSLRVWARHLRGTPAPQTTAMVDVLEREASAEVNRPSTYRRLASRALEQKLAFLSFLVEARRDGKSVVCFGAAAKGNTFLNYCGVHPDLLDYAVDSSPHKQGLYLPGSRLPIHPPAKVHETKPDYLLILPWNLRRETSEQMADIREWGGQFVVASPALAVF